jgi:outer membrane cobalamin receptor
LKNPIEFALSALTSGQLNTAPQNFGTAKVAGAEAVYSKYFGDLGVSGNYTYTYSRINTTKIYTSTDAAGLTTSVPRVQSRPMQGQSGNVANLSLLYKNDRNKAFVQLAYTYTSKTLALVYNNYGYDYYQQPQSFLSLSGEKQINRHLVLTAKVNNLLNTPTTIKISNLIQSRDVANVSFNAGIRYSH